MRPRDGVFGRNLRDEDGPDTCDCAAADPDGLGECRSCRRLVAEVALARFSARVAADAGQPAAGSLLPAAGTLARFAVAVAARVDPPRTVGTDRAASGPASSVAVEPVAGPLSPSTPVRAAAATPGSAADAGPTTQQERSPALSAQTAGHGDR